MASSPRRLRALFAVSVAVIALLAWIPLSSTAQPSPADRRLGAPQAAPQAPSAPVPNCVMPAGCDKLQHLIFIVQENRSFDHYFGTYRGAAGIPKNPNGAGFAPRTCIPDQYLGHCVGPYHAKTDVQIGGAHSHKASVLDVNGGKMNGFVAGAASGPETRPCIVDPYQTWCNKYQGPKDQPDIMSYRNRSDIPNYWAMADYGVLQDHLFASVDSYTLPSHLFIFSGWSATCPTGPASCKSAVSPASSNFAWTPMAFLLDKYSVDWAWYVGQDTNICHTYPKCPPSGNSFTPPNWNPPPGFPYVENNDWSNLQKIGDFRDAITNGTLPEVSWVIPSEKVSEHPGKGSMRPGYNYVSDLVTKIGASTSWDSTAVFIFWDDWGGFYDHLPPTRVDGLGYGIRVPGIMISPYAKQGYVDHQILSPDAMLKLMEDRFTNGERLDPSNPGFPADARPNVRENESVLGDLQNEFDFTQSPRPAPVLPD